MASVYYRKSEQNINFNSEKFETEKTSLTIEEMEQESWLKHLEFMSRIPLSIERAGNDAFNAGITSKNNRTKVFNGSNKNKTIPSLLKLCIQSLQNNIDDVGFVGKVPFLLLEPVLEKATPEQLNKIESLNPHLIVDSDQLWKKHCEMKFRYKQRQALETWKEMFIRCNVEEEARLKYLTEKIRLGQKAKREPIKKTKKIDVSSGRSRQIVVKKPVLPSATHVNAAPDVRPVPPPTTASRELRVARGTTTVAALPGTTSTSGTTTAAALPGTTSTSGTTTAAALPGTTSTSGTTTAAALPGSTSTSGTTTAAALPGTTSTSGTTTTALRGPTSCRAHKLPKKAPLMQKALRQLKNCRR